MIIKRIVPGVEKSSYSYVSTAAMSDVLTKPYSTERLLAAIATNSLLKVRGLNAVSNELTSFTVPTVTIVQVAKVLPIDLS